MKFRFRDKRDWRRVFLSREDVDGNFEMESGVDGMKGVDSD